MIPQDSIAHYPRRGTPSGGSAVITNMLVDTAGCPSCGGGGGLSQVVADTDASGKVTAAYLRVGDELLAVMRPGSPPATWSTRFIYHDGLGSVRTLTDETGTTTDTRGYEAYGTKNAEAGSDPLSYGFAGEAFEPASMLAYHRSRWMDSRVGRFVAMDSWPGDEQQPVTLHRYVYAQASPVDMIDPSGRTAIQGIMVHNAVGADFISYGDFGRKGKAPVVTTVTDPYSPVFQGPCRLSNRWIQTILSVLGAGRQRPDLIDRCTKEIWEIKQDDDEGDAINDVIYYISLLEAQGDPNYWPGTSYDPIPTVYLPDDNFAEVWTPSPGVILYHIYSSSFKKPVPSPFDVPSVQEIPIIGLEPGLVAE